MLVGLCPAILSSDTVSDPGRRDLLRARRRLCGSECCSSNSNAPDTSQKSLIGIQSHHSRGKMAKKKTREKTEEAGSASVSPYGSVLGYEQVTSQPSRPITLVWPEYRTWFIQTEAERRRREAGVKQSMEIRLGSCMYVCGWVCMVFGIISRTKARNATNEVPKCRSPERALLRHHIIGVRLPTSARRAKLPK